MHMSAKRELWIQCANHFIEVFAACDFRVLDWSRAAIRCCRKWPMTKYKRPWRVVRQQDIDSTKQFADLLSLKALEENLERVTEEQALAHQVADFRRVIDTANHAKLFTAEFERHVVGMWDDALSEFT